LLEVIVSDLDRPLSSIIGQDSLRAAETRSVHGGGREEIDL
jgi:hypothetical protein